MFLAARQSRLEASVSSRSEIRSLARSETDVLLRRVDSLELACAGLWELLKAKGGYTDDELIAAVQRVDLSDGKLDGKIRKTAQSCTSCNRKMLSRKSPACPWCGASVQKGPF